MVRRIWLVWLLLSVIIATAAATTAYTAPAEPQTRVETDQKTGAVRFIVNGREEARIDTTGLHVRQSVDYGGMIVDEGQAGYDHRQANAAHAR